MSLDGADLVARRVCAYTLRRTYANPIKTGKGTYAYACMHYRETDQEKQITAHVQLMQLTSGDVNLTLLETPLCRGHEAFGKGPLTLSKGFAEGGPRQRALGKF